MDSGTRGVRSSENATWSVPEAAVTFDASSAMDTGAPAMLSSRQPVNLDFVRTKGFRRRGGSEVCPGLCFEPLVAPTGRSGPKTRQRFSLQSFGCTPSP
jgi:hypothetical protein